MTRTPSLAPLLHFLLRKGRASAATQEALCRVQGCPQKAQELGPRALQAEDDFQL